MQLPRARGPISADVRARLSGAEPSIDPATLVLPQELTHDDDLQLALWMLYELHYRGFDDVSDALEWAPDVIGFRGALEVAFEAELRSSAAVPPVEAAPGAGSDFIARLREVIESGNGPSVAGHVQRRATLEQLRELFQQRSIYHLKESDPHAWAIPRVDDGTKAALAELLYDEYGSGRAPRVHATMFASALAAMDLDASYGAHIDRVPGYTLAENNMMSLFGLHRRLRGVAMGHLAAFESTSSLPCRRYAMGIRRLGLPEVVAEYYDEHVEADAVHEHVAVHDVCGRLVAASPELEDDVLFGAAAYVWMESITATAILDAWARGESSLLPSPIGAVA